MTTVPAARSWPDAISALMAETQCAAPFLSPTHRLGIHPRFNHGRAVWICPPTGHVVAPIGSLRESAT
jgi:hypothetical protein